MLTTARVWAICVIGSQRRGAAGWPRASRELLIASPTAGRQAGPRDHVGRHCYAEARGSSGRPRRGALLPHPEEAAIAPLNRSATGSARNSPQPFRASGRPCPRPLKRAFLR